MINEDQKINLLEDEDVVTKQLRVYGQYVEVGGSILVPLDYRIT